MTREEKLQQFAEQTTKGLYLDRHNLIQMVKQGAEWADSHPHWIPVEEELPKEQGKYMFRLSNGDMCYETYYPKLKLVANVTHWMEIVPPRKEDNK